ncbi:MAG: TetR/AcrR family transcriptional regulator [Actinobacteria bacterium]|nr:TetR/AcrR family transcriptional regulator [Actinomycetota bacterium]
MSLGGLAERVGLSKSGLFAHFRSKEDLQVELLRFAEGAFEREIAPAFEAPEGLPRLRAFVGRWLGWASRCGLPGGCPFAGAVFELDDAEGPVRDYLVAGQEAWAGMVRGLVEAAVALGHLREDLDAEQFAWQLHGIYLAHHVSQRLTRDPNADRRAHAALDALLDSARPA